MSEKKETLDSEVKGDASAEPETKEKKSSRAWLWVLLVLLIAIVLAVVVFSKPLAAKPGAVPAAAATEAVQPTQTPWVITMTPQVVSQSTATAMPTQEAVATEQPTEVVKTEESKEIPGGSILLGNAEAPVGYTYPIGFAGPWSQSVPEGGFVLVACGNCTVDGEIATSNGTVGNIFLLIGNNPDGSTPADLNWTATIEGYKPGHVQVTFIYAGKEDPRRSALNAVANMFVAPGCGRDGCKTVNLFTITADHKVTSDNFTSPPK